MCGLRGSYPNLPLIEERFLNAIAGDLEKEKEKAAGEGRNWYGFECEAVMFRQCWPNVAGIFETPGCMSGQAFTTSYTTVIRELRTGVAGVFGGNRLAYIVKSPGKPFMDDMNNRDMENVGRAVSRYSAIAAEHPAPPKIKH